MAKQLYLHGIESTGKRYIADDSGDHLIDFAPNVVTFPGRDSNVFNALTYGADPTGVTPAHEQIQAAIDAASTWAVAAGGETRGQVILPPGRYIGGNFDIKGKVDMWCYGATFVRTETGPTGQRGNFTADGVDNWSMRGLTCEVDPAYTGLVFGIKVEGCDDWLLTDTNVASCNTWAYRIRNASRFTMLNCSSRADDIDAIGNNDGLHFTGVSDFAVIGGEIHSYDDMLAITHTSTLTADRASRDGVFIGVTGSSASRLLLLLRDLDSEPHIRDISMIGCRKAAHPTDNQVGPGLRFADESTSKGGIYDVTVSDATLDVAGLDVSPTAASDGLDMEYVNRLTLRDVRVLSKSGDHAAEFEGCDDLVIDGLELTGGALDAGLLLNGCQRARIRRVAVDDTTNFGLWTLNVSDSTFENFAISNTASATAVRTDSASHRNVLNDFRVASGVGGRSITLDGNDNRLERWDHSGAATAPLDNGTGNTERGHVAGSTALLPAITGATASASQVANDTADLVIANGDATDSRT